MANYLYNGVELPALPEWDTEKYPYAYLVAGESATVRSGYLWLFSEPMHLTMIDGNGGPCIGFEDGGTCLYSSSTKSALLDKPFSTPEELSYTGRYVLSGPPTWSNYNVKNADGTLYLAASEPVPVSPVKLNPALLVPAFMVGGRLREQRAKRMLHDHTYSAEVTAPTCTEKGYTTCTCASCGHRYVSNLVPATGHDYVSEVIAPTTKAQGYTQHTCSRCGDSYKDNYTERLPVAYSYNGTELPALPEYDTTAYPYAFIFTNSSGTTNFYYSNQPFHGYSSVMDLVTNLTDCTLGTYKISNGAWIVGTAPQEYATKVIATNIPFWANYDVLDSREQLWCAASDPVPIYE